jgi:lysophospholipase L1-like esterase
VSVLLKCLGDVVPRLLDDEGTAYVAWKGRVDPDLAPGNVAVGNCSVREVAAGIDDGNLAGVMLGHLVYDPFAEVMAPVKGSQIGLIEAAKPTLVLSVDFFGNDVLWGVVMGSVIDTSYCTPADVMLPAIEEIVSRLAATGAEVFLANLPGTSMLPATAERRRQSIEAGVTDVDARIAAIDALGEAANAALAAAAAKHANVHVVDLVTWADRIARDGLPVGDQVLTTGKFGGLVGLDGIHFTSTGYAVVANVFADAINATLGTAIPLIDLAAVVAGDPESPQALAASGLAECVAGGPSGLSSPR